MCRAVGEGGLRCAAHTRPAFQQATPGTPTWDQAAAAYAATREGRLRLTAERDNARNDGNIEHQVATETALAAGIRAREVAHQTWTSIQNHNPQPTRTGPGLYGATRAYYPDENESGNIASSFSCEALTTVLASARRDGHTDLRVTRPVTGHVDVLYNGRGAGYSVEDSHNQANRLRCTCAQYRVNYRCPHIDNTITAIQSRINQDALSEGHVHLAIAEQQHYAPTEPAPDAVEVVDDGINYSDDPAAFKDDYRAARSRMADGDNPIEYMTENATNGLGAPGGRSFGIELEFSTPDVDAGSAIARDLHAAGLTPHNYQTGYHSDRTTYETHDRGWKFEYDCTVHNPGRGMFGGEIISPKMHDTPETWERLQKVCDIVEAHGGRASVRAGSHIHVSSGDFRRDGSDHGRLLHGFSENEDLVYRLATNPVRGTHRRVDSESDWSAPNNVAGRTFASLSEARARAPHSTAVNLENCSGRASDHVEFRMWDSTLKPANIQAQVKLSLAMTEAAHRDADYQSTGHTPVGSRRRHNRETYGADRRLTGEQWDNDTASYRSFADKLFTRAEDKKQITALFAATKWQFKSRRRSADRNPNG